MASVFCFQHKVHTERGELLLIIARPESDLFVLWHGSHGRSITITTHPHEEQGAADRRKFPLLMYINNTFTKCERYKTTLAVSDKAFV